MADRPGLRVSAREALSCGCALCPAFALTARPALCGLCRLVLSSSSEGWELQAQHTQSVFVCLRSALGQTACVFGFLLSPHHFLPL